MPVPPLLRGLQRNHFRAGLVDCPWLFKSNSTQNPGRNALGHYDCMTLQEIANLPVGKYFADDSAIFFWITGPFLVRGAHLPIFDAWGFKPSGMGFVWIKLNPRAPGLFFMSHDIATGGGMTTRKNAEFCLIGRRGKSLRRSASVHEVIIAQRRQHSRKPDEARERIERYTEGPYLELFARSERPGWVCRGNESSKFK